MNNPLYATLLGLLILSSTFMTSLSQNPVKSLIEEGLLEVHDPCSKAALEGNIETVKKFIEEYKGKNTISLSIDACVDSALRCAIYKGNLELVRYLLPHYSTLSEEKSFAPNGSCPLLAIACVFEHEKVAVFLMENISYSNEALLATLKICFGTTNNITLFKHIEEKLKEKKITLDDTLLNIIPKEPMSENCAHFSIAQLLFNEAFLYNNITAVQYLIEELGYGSFVNSFLMYPFHCHQVTPLLWASIHNDLPMARYLVEHGANVTTRVFDEQMALLLESNLHIDAQSFREHGMTALEVAQALGHQEVANYLANCTLD